MKKAGRILILGMILFTISMFIPSFVAMGQMFQNNDTVAEDIENIGLDGVEDPMQVGQGGSDSEEDQSNIEGDEPDTSGEGDQSEEPKEDGENEGINPYDAPKKVFLTFDDGPTSLTPKILDILKEEDVPATFFVIGRLLDRNPQYALRAYEEGHSILPHSYSHDYAIYSTFDTFYEDFYKAERAVENLLGYAPPPIFRFPGGSGNHSSFEYGGRQFMPKLTEDVKERGYYYIDWNALSGDTGPDFNDPDKMLQNILNGAAGKDFVVVLFHDVPKNEKILDMLPELITTLRDQGYVFRSFRDVTDEELEEMVELRLANRPVIRQ